MPKSIQSDQTWTGTLSPHPGTLLLSHTVSHALMSSMSDFYWFMPSAVKIPELQKVKPILVNKNKDILSKGITESVRRLLCQAESGQL